jgi:hypothetical protein
MTRSVVLAFAFVLFGCASEESEDECARVRVECPNEPPLVDECRAVAASCPATARALFLCIAGRQVCDGRGRLDRVASAARCPDEQAENDRCLHQDAATDATSDTGRDTGVEDTTVEDASDAAPEVSSDTKSDGKPG